MGFFDKLKQGLNKTKESLNEKINNVFSNFRKVDEDFLEELEEALIMSDIGIETSTKIISNLRDKIKKEKIEDEEQVKEALREERENILEISDNVSEWFSDTEVTAVFSETDPVPGCGAKYTRYTNR